MLVSLEMTNDKEKVSIQWKMGLNMMVFFLKNYIFYFQIYSFKIKNNKFNSFNKNLR